MVQKFYASVLFLFENNKHLFLYTYPTHRERRPLKCSALKSIDVYVLMFVSKLKLTRNYTCKISCC